MRARAALTVILALPITLAACGTEAGAPTGTDGDVSTWALSAEPVLRIGVVEGDEAYQLHDVRDAVRLPDGRIALAHQGTREVRIYGPDGAFLTRSGGEGDGPGEWRLVAGIHDLGGDTLLVEDPRLDRFGLVNAGTGAYLGELDESLVTARVPQRRHRAGLILEAPPELGRWDLFEPVTTGLDIRDDSAPTRARLDRGGRVWVFGAPSAEPRSVRVFDLEGTLRATLPLPPRFEPLALDDREVIGVWRDSLDVEHVRVHGLEGTEPWSGPTLADAEAGLGSSTPLPTSSTADVPELSAGFRSVAVAQEMHYARAGSYTTDVAALAEGSALEIPETGRLDLLAAEPTGWWGRLVDTQSGAGCTLVYGAFLPVEGIEPGALTCWEGTAPAADEPGA